MKKANSPKLISLTFGILVILFAIGFYIFAWQEPSQVPPGGNVSTPLNVGPTGQSKAGGLILNTGDAEKGLIIDKGQICIGTDCRNKWPETGVVTTYRMEASGYQVGNKYFGKTVSYNCPEGSNVVNVYLNQSMVSIGSANTGGCNGGCQAGQCSYTQQNSCSYSISERKITLNARVVEIYKPDCWCCIGYSLVDYCYPRSSYLDQWTCQIPGGCVTEFQCGTKQTVGQ